MKFLDNEQRVQIGFSFVMDELGIITTYGAEEKKKLKPYKVGESKKLKEELNNIENMINHMKDYPDEFNDIVKIGRAHV